MLKVLRTSKHTRGPSVPQELFSICVRQVWHRPHSGNERQADLSIGLSALLALATVGQSAVIQERATATCTKDACLEVLELFAVVAKPFCSAYTKAPTHTLPAYAARWSRVPEKISSACTCLNGGKPTAAPTTATSSATATAASSIVVTSPPSVIVTSSPTTTVPVSTGAPSDACHVTAYSAIPAAVASCTSIVLDGITVPGNKTIDLTKLKTSTKVMFKGTTFWEYFDGNYPFIKVSGTNLEITAAEGAILDGNGQSWWDGLGSNGGVAK
jgi:polygalacturonase